MTQKVHQVGQLFGRALRAQTDRGTCGAAPLIGSKNENWQIRPKPGFVDFNQYIIVSRVPIKTF